jgi:hypothetical protein
MSVAKPKPVACEPWPPNVVGAILIELEGRNGEGKWDAKKGLEGTPHVMMVVNGPKCSIDLPRVHSEEVEPEAARCALNAWLKEQLFLPDAFQKDGEEEHVEGAGAQNADDGDFFPSTSEHLERNGVHHFLRRATLKTEKWRPLVVVKKALGGGIAGTAWMPLEKFKVWPKQEMEWEKAAPDMTDMLHFIHGKLFPTSLPNLDALALD